jgi:hypothetical protein
MTGWEPDRRRTVRNVNFDNPGGEFSASEVERIEEEADRIVRTDQQYAGDYPYSNRSTLAEDDSTPNSFDNERVSVAEPFLDALRNFGWYQRWRRAQFGSGPNQDGAAETHAEDTYGSLRQEAREARSEVDIPDWINEQVTEGTGNDSEEVQNAAALTEAGPDNPHDDNAEESNPWRILASNSDNTSDPNGVAVTVIAALGLGYILYRRQ